MSAPRDFGAAGAADTAALGPAVLFDLDDTLVDYSGNSEWAWTEACNRAVERLPGLDAARLRETVRTVNAWYWGDPDRHRVGRSDLRAATALIVGKALDQLRADDVLRAPLPPDLPRVVAHHYRDLRDGGLALLDGAVDVLETLRSAGTRLALVTNGTSADQRMKIERFDLARHFDHVQIEGEFGAGKPEATVYRHALDALDVAPADATFVGDNLEWDVAAPMRLGLRAVWIDGAGAGLPADGTVAPTRIVRHVRELLDAPRGNADDATETPPPR